MVEIPVERKSGVPWWLWLLGLLLLGLLLWWILDEPDPEVAAVDPIATEAVLPAAVEPAPVETAAVAGPPISDVILIVDAPDRPVLAGREVRLANMRVLDVVGDRTFFVGPDANRRLFVVLNEAVPGDSAIDINPGQTVNLQGVLRRPGDGVIGGQPIEGMPAGTDLFLHAQTAEIVKRP